MIEDLIEGRKGSWMHTHSGRRFFPQDPRPEDFCIEDIANGLAHQCRYAGQLPIDRHYSIAEHCFLMTQAALIEYRLTHRTCLAVLLHDAAEAFLTDLPYAVKQAVNGSYRSLEDNVEEVIFKKYQVWDQWLEHRHVIKEIDNRIVPLEKEMCRHQLPWTKDRFEPLKLTKIQNFERKIAKEKYIAMFDYLGATEPFPE